MQAPHYILGRFQTFRSVYGNLQCVRQRLGSRRPELQISEKYKNETQPVSVNPSGLVASAFDAETHVQNLSKHSYSGGIQLTDAAREAISLAAMQLPLEENGVLLPSFAETMTSAVRHNVAIATVRGCSRITAIQSIAGDAAILDVVSSYLGYFPTRVSPWLF